MPSGSEQDYLEFMKKLANKPRETHGWIPDIDPSLFIKEDDAKLAAGEFAGRAFFGDPSFRFDLDGLHLGLPAAQFDPQNIHFDHDTHTYTCYGRQNELLEIEPVRNDAGVRIGWQYSKYQTDDNWNPIQHTKQTMKIRLDLGAGGVYEQREKIERAYDVSIKQSDGGGKKRTTSVHFAVEGKHW